MTIRDSIALTGATTGATTGAATTATATTTSTVTTSYQETSSRIAYSGRWTSIAYGGYLGDRAKYSRQKGATASFRFSGTGVSWIGPTGPGRGKAHVFIDGIWVRTVDTYSSTFVARRTIFSINFSTLKTRTLKVVVGGTSGRPVVAIDAFQVRTPVTTGRTVNVASIPALRSALADDTVGQIVVANGTYRISPSSQNGSNSLWIGPQYARRTRPVLVRAATIGGVTFDGGGGSGFRALSFEGGAHHQTWDGFNFANMRAVYSGIIEVGGYTTRAAPHHITLRHIKVLRSCTGRATTANGNTFDHAVYIGQAAWPGPHDLVFQDLLVQGEGNLATAFHFFHGRDLGGYNAHNVTIRRLTVTGTQQAFLIWEPSVYNIVLDTATITRTRAYAIRYETIGSKWPSGIQIRNVTSTGSGYAGFHSSGGSRPPGIVFYASSLR